jgi:uncharacterized protein YabE (DUF348 family)
MTSFALLIAIAACITVIFLNRKVITVFIDEQPQKIVTFKRTVGKVLESKKISLGSKDKIEPSLETSIIHKGSISIKRAVDINIVVDGKELSLLSAEDNIDAMLKTEGITLKPEDKINPPIETKLSKDMKIQIVRVETKTFTDSLPIDFKTIVKYESSLANTQRRISQEGKPGEKQITTNVVYEDDKEVSRKVTNEVVAKEPVDKLIVQGTYPVMPISRGGEPVPYGRVFKAKATAYWAVKGVGKTYTASGRLAVRNVEGYSTIAVDPNVIPYGTRLFVENYGFATAADTGTAIVGDTIDVYFNTKQEAMNWAVKYVNVYVLK